MLMKKFFLLLLLAGVAGPALAQEPDEPKVIRKRFFNISYLSDKIKPVSGEFNFGNVGDIGEEIGNIANGNLKGIKNNWGISLTRGRTYALHAKPIARLITIGIDASFFDLSYSNYTLGWDYEESFDGKGGRAEASKLHKMEYSLQVGPSVTITPGKQFTIAAYARFAPSFSAYYYDESFGGNYMSMLVTGASFNYRSFGLGIEARMGACKYKNFGGDLDFSAMKVKTSGFRVFFQYRWR